MAKDFALLDSYTEINGILGVKKKNDSVAFFNLYNVNIDMKKVQKDGTKTDYLQNEKDEIELGTFKSNGNLSDEYDDYFFQILFQLPSVDLKVGEEDTIPMNFSIMANNTKVGVSKGSNTLKFIKYEVFDGKDCAVLTGNVDISKMEFSYKQEGDFTNSLSGKVTYYYDLETNSLLSVEFQIYQNTLLDGSFSGSRPIYMGGKNDESLTLKIID